MRTTSALKHARKAKNDEFYTRHRFIEDELIRHDSTLKGKSILCPCDHPMYSEFGSWFIENFNRLHLKEFVSQTFRDVSIVTSRESHVVLENSVL